MKTPKITTVPSAIAPVPPQLQPQPGAPPSTGSKHATPATRTKTHLASARKNMLLANQAGLRRQNPPWSLVERVIRELNPGFGNSHCILTLPSNTYVQTLCGFNGWHLEWRISDPSLGASAYIHMRACYPGGSQKPFELKKHDFMSYGEYRDLMNLEDVIDSFRAFHHGDGLPTWLEWRDLDI